MRATRIGTDLEIVLGVIGILVLAECCRRVVGLPILCVASCFVIYAFVAGKTLKSIIYNLFYTTTGVIGTPIGVCSTFIVLFIIFGAFLEATGISDFFIDLRQPPSPAGPAAALRRSLSSPPLCAAWSPAPPWATPLPPAPSPSR